MTSRIGTVLVSLLASVAALTQASAQARAPGADSVISREGIGPVRVSMSEGELVEALGAESVERFDAYIGEGFCAPGSRVFPDTDAEIEVLWSDPTYSVIAAVRVERDGSPWRTPDGVGVGSTLRELEASAGAPVEFSGFGWDYGGRATWSEGDLRLGLTLAATQESESAVSADARYVELLGERRVQSDHPLVRRLSVFVVQASLAGLAAVETEYECGEEDQ